MVIVYLGTLERSRFAGSRLASQRLLSDRVVHKSAIVVCVVNASLPIRELHRISLDWNFCQERNHVDSCKIPMLT